MNPAGWTRLLASTAVFLLSVSTALAIQPTWAKKAVAFPSRCGLEEGAAARTGLRTALAPPSMATSCKPIRIPSPDKQLSIEIEYGKVEIDQDDHMLIASFRLHLRDGSIREGSFPDGFQNIDLLWSPDSKAFFVNGGNGGGYWGFFVYVYHVDDSDLEPVNIMRIAQLDMVKTFPPCRASYLDREECVYLEKEPDANMSGIDWAGDSSAFIVMAEVPCSGGHGGIMCQVMGYKLDAKTGAILERMPSPHFKHEWQPGMAFRFHIPDPPEYCEKGNSKQIPGCIGHDW
ncbi:hypothetical protein [Occallatibacter riparius]|uniref:Uncharacterized protein n=1 Tax=Occallatibacter riparius TaxID=1002689 RepID=A0A9J7BN00_9BACT|nr:hypothetical protein [Occallatibacter riparius]UWZ83881.1 hypothetical protein MOP44_25405 [Occallatibacter riparius]